MAVLANRANDDWAVGDNNRMSCDGDYAYLYDAEGNREYRFEDNDSSGTISSGDTNIRQFVWDHRNRLTAVKDYADYSAFDSESPSQVVQYAYDFGNRWVRKIFDPGGANEEKTIFVYDGGQIALRFHKEGSGDLDATNLTNRYLWGPAVDQILADEQVHWDAGEQEYVTDELLWPLGDHLGSVRDVIDSSGTVKIHRVYDAFGNFTEDPSTAGHLFAFTARPFDPATGLQNNLNRWYDAQVGRWLSEDPIGYEAGEPNLYRYVGNCPNGRLDPNGLDVKFGPVPVGSASVYFRVAKGSLFNVYNTGWWSNPQWCGTGSITSTGPSVSSTVAVSGNYCCNWTFAISA